LLIRKDKKPFSSKFVQIIHKAETKKFHHGSSKHLSESCVMMHKDMRTPIVAKLFMMVHIGLGLAPCARCSCALTDETSFISGSKKVISLAMRLLNSGSMNAYLPLYLDPDRYGFPCGCDSHPRS
jgi:hypothetical protein